MRYDVAMDFVGYSRAQKSAMWGSRRGSRTLVEEQLLSYSDIYKFFSSMAPSLDDRLLAGERG